MTHEILAIVTDLGDPVLLHGRTIALRVVRRDGSRAYNIDAAILARAAMALDEARWPLRRHLFEDVDGSGRRCAAPDCGLGPTAKVHL